MTVRSADVARRAGVSRATVSQILNGHGHRFAPGTQLRVEQAAAELNYQPSAAARTLVTGSSEFVVALIPDTTFGGNLQDLFQDATSDFAAHGLTLVLRLATGDPAAFARTLAGVRPRAVMSLTPFTDTERAALDAAGVPGFAASRADFGAFDVQVGRMQARYLADRGHRRLAFAHLRDDRQDPFGDAREEGVRLLCRERGLPDPAVVHLGIGVPDASAALDALGAPGVAVACYNDDVATALLGAAHLRSLRVPADVALIGMDHTPLGQVTVPPLTTISYDVTAGGRAVTAQVLAAITGAPFPDPVTAIDLQVVPGGTA